MATLEVKTKHDAALKEFNDGGCKKLSPECLEVLKFVGKTGCNCYPWDLVKPLLRLQLAQVLDSSSDTAKVENPQVYEGDKKLALDSLDGFTSAPFTIQRLCEFLTDSVMTGDRKEKIVWALLKLLCVSTTVEQDLPLYEQPAPSTEEDQGLMPAPQPLPFLPPSDEPFNPQASFPAASEEAPAAADATIPADSSNEEKAAERGGAGGNTEE